MASALHIDVVRQAGAMLAAVAATSWLMGHVLGLKPFNRARLAKPRG